MNGGGSSGRRASIAVRNTILIIDDDPDVIEMTQSLLEPRGYRILSSPDGEDGYWQARTKEPDLIICDLLLPRGHGFELLQKVRSRKSLETVPVVLITAVYKGQQYKEQGQQYGASAFLEKPLIPETLLALVHRLLPLPGKAPQGSTDKLEQEIAKLRADYLSKLPAVIDWISNRCHTLLNDQWDAEGAELLHRATHRMIGSGKNLKLDHISDAASQMELFLDGLLEQGAPPTPQERERLEHLLADLCSAATLQAGKPAGNA